MIIASRIGDGRVVYMGGPGAWVASIDAGRLIEDEADAERLLAAAKDDEAESLVIDPYLIEVEVDDAGRRPTSNREAIRAFGPSSGSEVD
jgi:hypothetical protein